jgi:microcystin-dependent protein
MGEKFMLSDASRIIDVIDGRIKKLSRSSSMVETTWGEIASIAADGKTAGAYLYGETDGAYISGGFRVPETMYVTLGDKVRVAMDYATGDRWIEEINVPSAYKKLAFSPTDGTILTGDGTVPPTAFSGTPSGAVMAYAGSAAPSGWLLADGTAVSRTTYADLFAVVGTTYGVGDGSTTFNLPNLKGRFPVGRDAAQTEFDTLAETGGAKTHTHAGHSAHVFTQPSAHAALAHSAHTGTAVGDHAAQAHSAHSGTAVSAHASHSHELPFMIDDTYAISSVDTATFGTGTSRTRDWTSSVTNVSGSIPVADSQAVTVGAHTVTQPSAHSDHPLLSHSVTQPSAHSDHASQSHSGGAVDGHSAHDTPSSMNPYLVLNYIIKA